MGLPGTGTGGQLTTKDWVQVVVIAGIGSVLEWFDFFSYSQLDGTLKAVFFPGESDTGYWAVFGLAMAARPIGALIFGHIGDTLGRSRTLVLGILCMAVATIAIGCLPTYDIGSYTAGVAAPILLGFFRFLQGLAMGGEYGAAMVYISEIAGKEHRVFYTGLLQCTVDAGLLLALSLVMVLQATLTTYEMDIWGWRIPFFLAFFTALLGFWLRRGMPEPHAFLEAARRERQRPSSVFSKRQLTLLGEGMEWEAAPAGAGESGDSAARDADSVEAAKSVTADEESPTSGKVDNVSQGTTGGEEPLEPATTAERGALSRLQSSVAHSKVPMVRVLADNWRGVLIQMCYTSWATASFYATTTWLPSELRQGYMSTRVSQGILLVSLVPCVLGKLGTGWVLDRGAPSILLNAVVLTIGAGAGFGVFYGSFNSNVAAWLLMPAMLFLIGSAQCLIGMPPTRIYPPLERITGFTFAYNCATVIGGFTPNIVNAIQGSITASLVDYAAAFWLLGIAGLSLVACVLLHAHSPRLNKPFVGHLE